MFYLCSCQTDGRARALRRRGSHGCVSCLRVGRSPRRVKAGALDEKRVRTSCRAGSGTVRPYPVIACRPSRSPSACPTSASWLPCCLVARLSPSRPPVAHSIRASAPIVVAEAGSVKFFRPPSRRSGEPVLKSRKNPLFPRKNALVSRKSSLFSRKRPLFSNFKPPVFRSVASVVDRL